MPEQNELCPMPNTTYAIFRKCTPEWTLPRFVMPNYDLSYVIDGYGSYVINGERYSAAPGDLFCSPPGSVREGNTSRDRPMSVYAVDFHLKDFSGELAVLPLSVKTVIGRRKDLIKLFGDLTSVWNAKRPGYTIKIHGILLLILHRIFELCVYRPEPKEYDYRITRAMRYIDANYQEKIKVEQLAALTNLEPHYFNTLFSRKTGVSVHQYLIKTRIRNAYSMLQTGKFRVADVARLCGYTDVYHFYKQFKTVTGVSPAQCVTAE